MVLWFGCGWAGRWLVVLWGIKLLYYGLLLVSPVFSRNGRSTDETEESLRVDWLVSPQTLNETRDWVSGDDYILYEYEYFEVEV